MSFGYALVIIALTSCLELPSCINKATFQYSVSKSEHLSLKAELQNIFIIGGCITDFTSIYGRQEILNRKH